MLSAIFNFSTWLRFTPLLLVLCFVTNHVTANDTLCDPRNASSCTYGGACIRSPTSSDLVVVHRCSCPLIDCYREPFQPVCGSDGITHYNDLCRRKVECAQQKQIDPVCSGFCGNSSCKTITPKKRCSAEESNRCLNFGNCLISDSGQPYCECISNFQGSRCTASRDLPNRAPCNCDQTLDGINYKVAFLCCLGGLGLVVLLLIIYCLIKRFSHGEKELTETCEKEPCDNVGATTTINLEDEKSSFGSRKMTVVELGIRK